MKLTEEGGRFAAQTGPVLALIKKHYGTDPLTVCVERSHCDDTQS